MSEGSINQPLKWVVTPPELVQAHLNLDQQTMAALTKEKPIIVPPAPALHEEVHPEHLQLYALPDWPAGTIAVLTTVEHAPHAIPVSATLRAGDHSILFALIRSRGSLERLRAQGQVALTVLTAGNIAFTARGRARILQEPMVGAPEYAAVALEVEHIDDHRQSAFSVDSGVDRRWTDRDKQHAFGEVLAALRQLSVSSV